MEQNLARIKELIGLLMDTEMERADCEKKLNTLNEQERFYRTQLHLSLKAIDFSANSSLPVAKKGAKTP